MTHIRQGRNDNYATYCLQGRLKPASDSISEKHYVNAVKGKQEEQHIATLTLCPNCVMLIEEMWKETFELLRRRRNEGDSNQEASPGHQVSSPGNSGA